MFTPSWWLCTLFGRCQVPVSLSFTRLLLSFDVSKFLSIIMIIMPCSPVFQRQNEAELHVYVFVNIFRLYLTVDNSSHILHLPENSPRDPKLVFMAFLDP